MSTYEPAQAMSFVDRLRQRMTGSFSRPTNFNFGRPARKVRQVVETNRWDSAVWREARKTDVIDKLIYDLSLGDEHKGGDRKGFDPSPELIEALFYAFYKAAPKLVDKRRIERDVRPVRKILEEVLNSPKLQDLQSATAMDPIMSTVAVDAMGDHLREILSRLPEPQQPPGPVGGPDGGGGEEGCEPSGGRASDDGEEGDEEGSVPPPHEPTDDDLTDDEDREFDMDQLHEDALKEQAERDWEDEYDEALDEVDLERAVNKAIEEAQKEASEMESLRKGIGLEDGEWKTMNPEERLAMIERLKTPQMKALAELVGRMKRFALGVRATRIVDVPHEPYDVVAGDQLRHLLKEQYALLGSEETKMEFYRRLFDKELLQFKLRGTEDAGKGPIIVAIDKSGSMYGDPFNWAMAVAEALRRFAADEERDYYAMFFGSNNDRDRVEFPKGKGPFKKVLSFLSCVANGGTQFDGVLTEALSRATHQFDEEGKAKADIIFITDGMANLDEGWIKRFNEERERVGVRVFAVYIGGANDMSYYGSRGGGPIELLRKISNVVIPVSELTGESVRDIFAHV